MSTISNLLLNVQERIDAGQDPYFVAQELGIPIHWVYEALELLDNEDCSPYATVNS